jgi:pyroglutamyl-peptidase
MTNQTLLLTGFQPFDRWGVNPSWEAARAFDGQVIGGLRVASRLLPVEWERSWPALLDAIEETEPRWVLMLGLAGRISSISVESLARNVCSDKPDNAGKQAGDTVIVPGGEGELPVTLPVDAIIESIQRSGVPVKKSVDAGGYLCNHTLYRALLWSRTSPHPVSIGFIHVPGLPSDDPDAPGMALTDIVRATSMALSAIAEASNASLPI